MSWNEGDFPRLRDGSDEAGTADHRLSGQLRLLAGEGRLPLVRGAGFGRPPLRGLRAIRLATVCAGVMTVGGGASATAVLLVRHWHSSTAVATAPAPTPPQPAPAPVATHHRVRPPAPAPAPTPPEVAAAPPAPVRVKPPARRVALAPRPPAAPIGIAEEADLLRQALLAWRSGADDAGALALLDRYAARFPRGELTWEAAAMRARVLLHAGNREAALALLDRLPLSQAGVSAELIVIRGELRSLAGRCGDALADFDWVLHAPARLPSADRARALYGRASCRARLGDSAGAQQDRASYLRDFPDGPAVERLGPRR